jgi:hypothetical protein
MSKVAYPNMGQCLKLATLSNDYFLAGLATLGSKTFNLSHNFQAFNHIAEHYMLAVQPFGFDGTQKELGSICVGTSICHRQHSGSSVLQLKVLVLELVSIDALSSGSIPPGEITSLAHEVGDDPVEGGALEGKAFCLPLSSAQDTEVLCCFGDNIGTKLHDDSAEGAAISSHVEENPSLCHVASGSQNTC